MEKMLSVRPYLAQKRRDNPFLLIEDCPEQMLRFYLLMAVFVSRLLCSLNALLCFEREFIKTHRYVLRDSREKARLPCSEIAPKSTGFFYRRNPVRKHGASSRIVSLKFKAGHFDQS